MSRSYQPPGFDHSIDFDLSRNEGVPRILSLDLGPDRVAALTARYPDTSGLREAIAVRRGVSKDQVLVTAGGDDALFRCFLSVAGAPVVATKPSFEMIRRYAAQLGTPLIEVPWWDGDFPVADFAENATAGPAMAVVVSPNNPTGNVASTADLRKVADVYPLVVLDAAYAEFAEDDLTEAALEIGNVVVVRSLSKAWGLAGLRLGYLLGAADVVERVGAFGSPYAVSGLSAALAEALVREGENDDARIVAEHRSRLSAYLDEIGCRPLPSRANFVLATAVEPSWLVPAAASLGIGLRRFEDEELATCVRITVPGDEAGQERLAATLRAVLAPEALLFDLDGVLVDVTESYRAAIIHTAAAFGVSVTPEGIAAAKGAGNASDDWEMTRSMCAAAGVELPLDVVTKEFERIYQGDGGQAGLKLRERMLVDPRLLARWADRYLLAVVTARPRADAEEALRRFGIDQLFTTVVTREDSPAKPDPAPVRLAMERLGVGAGWMLGDTPDDLMAARGAGVVPIALSVPGVDPVALSAAARTLRSVEDLEGVLDAIR